MLAVGGLPVFNVVVVKFYINCMVAINRCMIVLVLILIYTSLTVNYSYLRIIRLTMLTWIKVGYRCGFWITNGVVNQLCIYRWRMVSGTGIIICFVT